MQYEAVRLFALPRRHPSRRIINDYTMHWIRNPVKGSTFDRVSRWFRWMPGVILLPFMEALGYDGAMILCGSRVVAHTFWQRHWDELHMFHVFVDNQQRRRGLMKRALAQCFIPRADELPNVLFFIMSLGGQAAPGQDQTDHEAVAAFCDLLGDGKIDLPHGIEVRRVTRFRFVLSRKQFMAALPGLEPPR